MKSLIGTYFIDFHRGIKNTRRDLSNHKKQHAYCQPQCILDLELAMNEIGGFLDRNMDFMALGTPFFLL